MDGGKGFVLAGAVTATPAFLCLVPKRKNPYLGCGHAGESLGCNKQVKSTHPKFTNVQPNFKDLLSFAPKQVTYVYYGETLVSFATIRKCKYEDCFARTAPFHGRPVSCHCPETGSYFRLFFRHRQFSS